MTSVIKAQLNFENLNFQVFSNQQNVQIFQSKLNILDILMVIKQVEDWFG